jgi:hypothetical protein
VKAFICYAILNCESLYYASLYCETRDMVVETCARSNHVIIKVLK